MALREYRWYATRQQARNELDLVSTDTEIVSDAKLDDWIDAASRFIEGETGRIFIPWTGAKKFDYQDIRYLFLEDDLLSVTTLTNGDDTEIVTGDYFLYPAKGPPYTWIECDISSGDFFLFQTTKQQAIEVDGQWGYTNDYRDVAALVTDDPLTVAATTLNVTTGKGSEFDTGNSILVESEQMFVESVATDALTVKRGMDGTTAAEHAKDKAVYIYQPPPNIVADCAILVARAIKRGQSSWSDMTAVAPSGYLFAKAMPPEVYRDLQRYKRL